MLFAKQLKYIDELEQTVYKTLQSVVREFDFVIVDYIVEKQMYEKGIDGTGKEITNKQTGRRGYTRTTIRIKRAKGQPTDRVTLRDEKKFHPSIKIDAYTDRFEVSSDVGYSKYLVKRYGSEILKPTNENMRLFFKNYFLPELKNKFNDKITR